MSVNPTKLRKRYEVCEMYSRQMSIKSQMDRNTRIRVITECSGGDVC